MNARKISGFCGIGAIAAGLVLGAPVAAQNFRLEVRSDGTAAQPVQIDADQIAPRLEAPPISIVERYRATKRATPADLRLLVEDTPAKEPGATIVSSDSIPTRSRSTAPIITVSNLPSR
jgi:hypothetical protein